MKKEIISKIQALLQTDKFEDCISGIRELRAEYNAIETKEEEEAKKAFIDGGGAEEEFSHGRDELDKEFMELMTTFNNKKKEFDDKRRLGEEKNYKVKAALIKELETLIKEETNIAASFRKLNDIRKRWDAAGKVPKEKYKELQHDFSLQLEYFYYNIDIYKTLKEYDLEKNLKIKKELVTKMKALLEEKSIKNIREQVELLVNDWDNTGPVFQEKWQEIRDEFWGNAAAVQKKIKDHYANKKEKYKENYAAKKKLCEEVKEINENMPDSEKTWRKATDRIIGIQKEWKKIGFASKKQNDQIWEEFRAMQDEFFGAKKEFYSGQKEIYGEVEKKKQALIDQAEKLKENTNWKETTAAFIQLQKRWKQSGSAGPKESRLWKKFNGAANFFFEAKKHYYDTLDDRMAENLKKKSDIVQQINDYKLSGDKEKDLEVLKKLSIEWNNVGIISSKQVNDARKEYNNALDGHYNKLGLKGKDKENTKFKTRVEVLRKSNNSDDLLQNERSKIRDQIKRLESEIVQYENNLGFFSSGKSDNPLLKMAEEKVQASKDELNRLKERLKLVHS